MIINMMDFPNIVPLKISNKGGIATLICFPSQHYLWARLRPIHRFWISEPDTKPNKVGSLGSDRYKDMIPLWKNGKFCISEPDTDPNWVGSFGSARYM